MTSTHARSSHPTPNRSATTAPSGLHAHAWREYRRRVRTGWLLLIGYVPLLALVALVSRADYGAAFIFGISGVIWAAIWIVTSLRLGRFRCPRCKREYFYKWPRQNGFARHCMHCGLRKWSVDNGQPSPAEPSSGRA
ncbi:MAG: hypothetical protein ACJ796_03210 [Gemmatimonadaceae bacterium]